MFGFTVLVGRRTSVVADNRKGLLSGRVHRRFDSTGPGSILALSGALNHSRPQLAQPGCLAYVFPRDA